MEFYIIIIKEKTNMKKRTLFLTVCILLAFSLVFTACGKKNASTVMTMLATPSAMNAEKKERLRTAMRMQIVTRPRPVRSAVQPKARHSDTHRTQMTATVPPQFFVRCAER